MKYIFLIMALVVAVVSDAQTTSDSFFTRYPDAEKERGKYTWVMHTPLRMTNYMKDTVTAEVRLQKMRNANDKWIIKLAIINRVAKCVYQGENILFRFADWSEMEFKSENGNNCEGLYQLDIPVKSIGTNVSTNKLKGALRRKLLTYIQLEHPAGYTDVFLTEEQSELIWDIINSMMDE